MNPSCRNLPAEVAPKYGEVTEQTGTPAKIGSSSLAWACPRGNDRGFGFAGDTVSIPQGVLHHAANIGTEDAVLAVSFSSAYREAVGYDTK